VGCKHPAENDDNSFCADAGTLSVPWSFSTETSCTNCFCSGPPVLFSGVVLRLIIRFCLSYAARTHGAQAVQHSLHCMPFQESYAAMLGMCVLCTVSASMIVVSWLLLNGHLGRAATICWGLSEHEASSFVGLQSYHNDVSGMSCEPLNTCRCIVGVRMSFCYPCC